MSKLWTFGDSFTFGHGCRRINDDETSIYNTINSKYFDDSKLIWPEYVAQKLNLELLNYGVNGVTNDYILDNIMKYSLDFKKEDIIVIQISTSARHDFPFMKEQKLLGGWNRENIDNIYDPSNKSPHFLKTIFSTNIVKDYIDGGEDALTHSSGGNVSNNIKLSKKKYDLIREFFTEFISTKKYYEVQIWRLMRICDILITLGLNVFMIHEDYWPDIYEKPKNLISTSDDGLLQEIIRNEETILHDTNGQIIDYHPSYKGHMTIGENILKKINENIDLHHT
jgi:hypothetical protein